MKFQGPNPKRIKQLYEKAEVVWPEGDEWHCQSRKAINEITASWISMLPFTETSKCLNAGAGTTRYNLNCLTYDNDLAANLVADSPNPIVGSIEFLPVSDEFFDFCICVGSVINYCDALASIYELSRVLSTGGYLIIEFERSGSGEFLFDKRHHKDVFPMQYQYNGQQHDLWLYSEKYIAQIMKDAGLRIVTLKRFHSASSLVYRFTQDQDKSASYIKYDRLCQLFSYQLAHNIIMLCCKE